MRTLALQLSFAGACLVTFAHTAAAATLCVNSSGTSGCKSTINAAVAAAAPGDTIKVAEGVYREDVVITKSLYLVGSGYATTSVEARGKSNGFFIDGTAASPAAGVGAVSITGFTVRDAKYEGILAASATGITITNNRVIANNTSEVDGTCVGLPAFETNEASDCGEGIHLMGVDHSIVANNISEGNSGGMLITDETGPNYSNLITQNVVVSNGVACGITLASHGPAALAHPVGGISFGVFNNTVSKNRASYNGLKNGGGAGIGMYSPGPGAVNYGNVAIQNLLVGNGLPGVAMHNHASVPGAPPIVFRDNSVIANEIRGNGADTGDAATAGPTGINVYSVVPVTGIVIANNVIEDEAIGVSFNSSATAPGAPAQMQAHLNLFPAGIVGISDIGAATVDGTLNWWGCSRGAGAGSCATTTAGVAATPWVAEEPVWEYYW
jgi:hypothetical protein